MNYRISRKDLDRKKKSFSMKDVSDREFLQWWRRNHGTGHEEKIEIRKRV